MGIARHADGQTHVVGLLQTLLPEVGIDGFVLETQYPDGYAAYLPVARGYELALGGIDLHEVTLHEVALGMMDGSGEDPGMEAQKAFLFASLQV